MLQLPLLSLARLQITSFPNLPQVRNFTAYYSLGQESTGLEGKRPLEDAPMAAVPKQANPLVPQPTPMNSPARGVTSTSLILIGTSSRVLYFASLLRLIAADDDIPLCLQVGDTIMHDEGEEEDQVLYSAVDF